MHYVNSGIGRLVQTLTLVLLASTGCREKIRSTSPVTSGVQLTDSFDEAYKAILVRDRTEQQRAKDWNGRYFGNWVRWTGKVMSITDHSITIKQRKETSTFDVSLGLSNDQIDVARQTLKKGSIISYTGRFDQYDDIWRTLYLVQGVILSAPEQLDLGLGLGK